jgi:uncharacterized alpha/beta hydrolase family protein
MQLTNLELMKKKLFPIIVIAFMTLSYLTIQAISQKTELNQKENVEVNNTQTNAIPIMVFDLFQIFLK